MVTANKKHSLHSRAAFFRIVLKAFRDVIETSRVDSHNLVEIVIYILNQFYTFRSVSNFGGEKV